MPETAHELATKYIGELYEMGASTEQVPNYEFCLFNDREIISDLVKKAYRRSGKKFVISKVISDDPGFRPRLTQLLNEPMPNPSGLSTNNLISRFAYELYRSREELSYRYPDLFDKDAVPFAKWLLISTDSSKSVPKECLSYVDKQLRVLGQKPYRLASLYHKAPFIRTFVLRFTNNKLRGFFAHYLTKK